MKIQVTDQDGTAQCIDAEPGWSLMACIREAGLPIQAECGGCCLCSTCHVYIDPAWAERLPPMDSNEAMTLDEGFDVRATSRLACQVVMTEDLDGLTVSLAYTG